GRHRPGPLRRRLPDGLGVRAARALARGRPAHRRRRRPFRLRARHHGRARRGHGPLPARRGPRMSALLLVNARLVNEGRIVDTDVLVIGERIERIGAGPVPANVATVDLAGRYLLPGIIDDQVHCREPGLTHKATLATESLAAVCGGVTSFLEMPNTKPPTTDRA